MVTPDAVVTRIESARRTHPGGALAFDGDGTLWSGDVGDDFFEAFLARGRVEPAAARAMLALAAVHGVEAPEGGAGLPRALHEAYLAGRVPEERAYEMMACACAGWPLADVQAFAREVVASYRLSTRIQGETSAILRWAEGAGVEVFVVSASPVAVVVEAVRALGVDAAHVLAARAVEAGVVLGANVLRPIPYNEGKVARLLERTGGRPLYAAFGDNAFDVPMLQHAELAVAVRPKPRLLARAGEVPGIVELARA